MNPRSLLFLTPAALLISQGLIMQSLFLPSLQAQPASAQPAANAVPAPANAVPAKQIGKGQEEVPGQPGVIQDKHAFGVLPNYRTAEGSQPYSPITVKQKFKIANDDTLDGPSFALAAFFSGLGQIENSNASFGQGVKGYAHRYGTGLADQIAGNYLTEAMMPSLLHQDPRYFRRGHGSILFRTGWAISRSFVARDNSGRWDFNYAEWLGNGMVASIGNAYYPDNRGFVPTYQRMFTQVGTDSISQVMKEFWPDVKKKFFHKNDGNVPVTPELKAAFKGEKD
jgi:hypothetical protein